MFIVSCDENLICLKQQQRALVLNRLPLLLSDHLHEPEYVKYCLGNLPKDSMPTKTTQAPSFRPIGEPEIVEIARLQPDCARELSEFTGNTPGWSPLGADQIREKVAEKQKKAHTAVFSIYHGKEFVGIGEWSSNWDTWSPYAWFMIWPDYRRKGIGRTVAGMLLDRCFLENPGHEVVAGMWEKNIAAVKFIKGLGFTDIGRMRRTEMFDGDYADTLFFDILRSEYLGKRKVTHR